MSGNGTEFHLSCGCHNLVSNVFIRQAAKGVQPAGSGTPPAVVEPPKEAIIFVASGSAVIRPVAGGDAEATVPALGIVGDKVVSTGPERKVEEDVIRYLSEHAPAAAIRKRPLTGTQALLPGLIEPHVHIVPTAMMLGWQDYSPFGETALDAARQSAPLESQTLRPAYTRERLRTRMRADVKTVPEGCWLLGIGVDTSLMEGFPDGAPGATLLTYINAPFLDGISQKGDEREVPILLVSASGHTVYVNALALSEIWDHAQEEAGKGIPLFENLVNTYGDYKTFLDKTQGVLQELPEMDPALAAIPEEQQDEVKADLWKHLNHFFDVARSRGVTMVYDAGMSGGMHDLLKAFLIGQAAVGRPQRMRIGMAHLVEKADDLEDIGSFTPPTERGKTLEGSIDLYYGSVKLVSDGSNQGLTGYQQDPYCCPPTTAETGYYGLYNYLDSGTPQYTPPQATPPAMFVSLVESIGLKGWPNMVHANGDQAVKYILTAYEESARGQPDAKTQRNRIEHCSLLDDGDLAKITALGVSPSYLIGHVGYWGWAFSDYIFKEKADACLDLCRKTADRGIPFTLHTDCAVSPLGPLRLMEQAVTRRMEGSPEARSGAPVTEIPTLNAAERLTPAQALKAVTYDAAWQCHADELVGSLERDKLADFVILDRDPLAMDADGAYMTMRFIRPREVWVGGVPALEQTAGLDAASAGGADSAVRPEPV